MSKYTVFDTCISDGDALVDALQTMGFKPTVHKNPVHLTGFQGDRRDESAHVVIPRTQLGMASNDMGFRRNDKGTFQAIISEFDQNRFNTDWQNKLKQVYAEKVTEKTAKARGYQPIGRKEIVGADGKVTVQMQYRAVR